MVFNVFAFSHVSSDNLNAQVHCHALPKALCQFNITRWSSSVRRSDNHPSGLIFFLFLAQVNPFYVLAIADLGPLSAPFEVWLFVSPDPLSALFRFWPIVSIF
jgi:hypothetical protein